MLTSIGPVKQISSTYDRINDNATPAHPARIRGRATAAALPVGSPAARAVSSAGRKPAVPNLLRARRRPASQLHLPYLWDHGLSATGDGGLYLRRVRRPRRRAIGRSSNDGR